MNIWTIGHSNRSLEEFVALLVKRGINLLADVRRYPGSRTNPQFHVESLTQALKAAGIGYHALPALGGRRSVKPGSRNTVWRNPSFQGYADHMETDEFKGGIDELLTLADSQQVAFMCSEAVWWRCHRSLIADYLTAQGHVVLHILSGDLRKDKVHPYTAVAQIVDGRLSYQKLSSQ